MTAPLTYLHGYGNHLESEAVPGVIPAHQNAPQRLPHGLYSEQINGTGFTVRRDRNQRVWLYRIRPVLAIAPWVPVDPRGYAMRFDDAVATPELIRHRPQPYPDPPVDFLAGITSYAGAGDPCTRTGLSIHHYAATADMEAAFVNADGDYLVVPQDGALMIRTELGRLHVSPGEIAILPRGIRFQVSLPDGRSRGFLSELYNGHHLLPERGPIGSNGLADARHFKAPVADFEDRQEPYDLIAKHAGALWRTTLPASPFDVVAWRGQYAPFKYDLLDFAAHWSVNVDHADPSVLTVLTCPHDTDGRNALDFAVFRGRWDPTEHSFRPPWFHRNSAIEFNVVIRSPSTAGPYLAGACSYTPYLSPHGVSTGSHAREMARADDSPRRLPDEELWVQWESCYPMRVTRAALDADWRDRDYADQFRGFPPARVPR